MFKLHMLPQNEDNTAISTSYGVPLPYTETVCEGVTEHTLWEEWTGTESPKS